MGSGDSGILRVLERSKELGFLGPGPVDDHLRHAIGFTNAADAAGIAMPRRVIDLGSGGGVPGLVVAIHWSDAELLLLDGSTKRCAFLEEAVADLDLGDRVSVRCGRAEDLAHEEALRHWADLVVARSFAAPAITAECAAGFLETGGHLIVSEPPMEAAIERWDIQGLAELGMGDPKLVATELRFMGITQNQPCPIRFPRRVGVPAKRPLF